MIGKQQTRDDNSGQICQTTTDAVADEVAKAEEETKEEVNIEQNLMMTDHPHLLHGEADDQIVTLYVAL